MFALSSAVWKIVFLLESCKVMLKLYQIVVPSGNLLHSY